MTMDVSGLGVDIVEIDRMRDVLQRSPAFRMKVFTQGERDYCDRTTRPEIHYALRFAAKEAVLKTLGTGFSGVRPTDVEVVNEESGRPRAVLHGNAKTVADEQGVLELHISLSFTHSMAVANAVAITEEMRPKVEERKDPREELAAAFKAARALLDEMGALPADDKPSGETADESVEKPVDESSRESVERPADGSAEEPSDEPEAGPSDDPLENDSSDGATANAASIGEENGRGDL